MLQSLGAAALAAILTLSVVSVAGEQPPTSLDPARGTVTLTHSATRAVGCIAKSTLKKLECKPERQDIDASADLVLTPVQHDVTKKDKRKPVPVALPKDSQKPVHLELGAGLWDIEWPARGRSGRFQLLEREELAIKLTTRVGACEPVKTECVLKTDRVETSLAIPKDARR